MRILPADADTARAGAPIQVPYADPSLAILRSGTGERLAGVVATLVPDGVLADTARPSVPPPLGARATGQASNRRNHAAFDPAGALAGDRTFAPRTLKRPGSGIAAIETRKEAAP